MQLVIELPDELGEQLLRQGNVSQFVQEAVRKILSDTYKTDNVDISFSTENKTFTHHTVVSGAVEKFPVGYKRLSDVMG
ncbi:MAG: hypothetical protein NTZ45_00380 [Methylococcales bacterium]|nr:hypothetical protein [Methylococcales bacterium]